MNVPGGSVLGEKVGPLPLVGWVGLGAGAIALFLAFKGRKNAPSTGVAGAGIDMLAPSAAEAFGTLQQQQQDLTNTLGSIPTGISGVSQQVTDLSGQTAAQTAGLTQQITGVSTEIAAVPAAVAAIIPQPVKDLGTGFFVGTDRRIHVGSPSGTGQAGYGSDQGLSVGSGWDIGTQSADPTVFLSPHTSLQSLSQ